MKSWRKTASLCACSVLGAAWIAVALAPTAFAADEAINSPIKTIYLVAHPHLDIGYTNPPQVVEKEYKSLFDNEIAFAKANPDYKYNIEETWQLRKWLLGSSEAEIETMVQLIRDGRFGLGGGHSTLHSTKAGIEELSRYLYDAERFRRRYNVPIETVFHTDSPGLPFSYPRLLSKSGIRFLVVGMNLFIGGGFDAPYHPYLFQWEGPDGSRIITWVTWTGYYEAWAHYGFRRRDATIDADKLEKALYDIVKSGYPYDAIMVQCSADNSVSARLGRSAYEAAQKWNAAHSSPRFVMARPEDFFEHVLSKNPTLPVLTGAWHSPWDTLQMVEPQSEKAAKNANDLLLSAEKMWALASAFGSKGYPHPQFDKAWDDILTQDEHSGGDGVAKRGGPTPQEINDTGDYFDIKRRELLQELNDTENSGADALFSHVKIAEPSVLVFNPLSWTRTDAVEVALPPNLAKGPIAVIDPQTSRAVPAQLLDVEGRRILAFTAADVPPFGLKRYALGKEPRDAAAPPKTDTASAARTLENSWFRIEADPDGTLKSVVDKTARKELVAPDSSPFGSMIQRTNLEYFVMSGGKRVDSSGRVTFSTASTAPGERSLIVRRENSPLAETLVSLYDNQRRVDIVQTVDRDRMATATLEDAALVYGFAFPLNFRGATCRIDTPAGWFDPARDSMKGAVQQRNNVNHTINLSRDDYSLDFITRDVHTHDVREVGPSQADPQGTTHTLISSIIYRKIDLAQLKGDAMGTTHVEYSASRRWQLRYSLIASPSRFDPAEDDRKGWEICTPLVARIVNRADGTIDPAKPLSLLSIDAPNAMLFDLKAAEFGDGLILKIREIAGTSVSATLSSDAFSIQEAAETNIVERDSRNNLEVQDGKVRVSLAPNEIKCIRLEIATQTPRQGRNAE